MNEDKSARYNRLKRRAGVTSALASTALLVLLTLSGASLLLRTLAERIGGIAGGSVVQFPLTVGVFVVLLTLINEVVGLPIAYQGGFVLERSYGLSSQSAGAWLVDQAKSLRWPWCSGPERPAFSTC